MTTNKIPSEPIAKCAFCNHEFYHNGKYSQHCDCPYQMVIQGMPIQYKSYIIRSHSLHDIEFTIMHNIKMNMIFVYQTNWAISQNNFEIITTFDANLISLRDVVLKIEKLNAFK